MVERLTRKKGIPHHSVPTMPARMIKNRAFHLSSTRNENRHPEHCLLKNRLFEKGVGS